MQETAHNASRTADYVVQEMTLDCASNRVHRNYVSISVAR